MEWEIYRPWKRIKYEKLQRAVTVKLCERELCFLDTAPLHSKIYWAMKFQADSSVLLELCPGQAKWAAAAANTEADTASNTYVSPDCSQVTQKIYIKQTLSLSWISNLTW